MYQSKTPSCLRMRTIWSESSLGAYWISHGCKVISCGQRKTLIRLWECEGWFESSWGDGDRFLTPPSRPGECKCVKNHVWSQKCSFRTRQVLNVKRGFVTPYPAGTWRKYNVASTSMQRHDVASTLRRRYIYVMYPLGIVFIKYA